jgi:hypothetical protein
VAKAGQPSSAGEFVCDLLLAASEIPQVDNEVPDRPLQRISIPLGIEGKKCRVNRLEVVFVGHTDLADLVYITT